MSEKSAFETIFEATTMLEELLEQKFGATGRGLHAKAISVQSHLGEGLMKKLHFLATIRNKLAHEPEFKKEVPLDRFNITHKQVIAALEALDPPDHSSLPPAELGRSDGEQYRSGSQVGRAGGGFGGTVAMMVLVFAGLFMLLTFVNSRSTNAKASAAHQSASLDDSNPAVRLEPSLPLWSIDHAKHANQAFPWREEQAGFISKGETGALPNETLWKVTSAPREVKVKGALFLEVDIELGGGKTKAKAHFLVGDGMEKTSSMNPQVRLEAKLPSHSDISSLALKSDGSTFSSLTEPYSCQREVPTGCAAWVDNGVTYIAISLVSFDNVLKIVYGR